MCSIAMPVRSIVATQRSLRPSVTPAIECHGAFVGPVEDYIPWVMARVAEYDSMQHALSTMLIDVETTMARAETYFTGYHLRVLPFGRWLRTFWGRYCDCFELRG